MRRPSRPHRRRLAGGRERLLGASGSRRPARLARGVLAGAVAAIVAAPALAPAQEAAVAPTSRLACVAPADAAGIDAMLTAAGSPLAGEGATFVASAGAVGLDPRALVAIAAHETLLSTYAPAQAINNPFGLGPGWSFASEAEAISTAASTLASGYLGQGLTTIPAIGAKWAPIGAANDPTGLNQHWAAGVSTYYAALGGDPARPLLLAAQDAVPTCTSVPAPGPAAAPPALPAPGGSGSGPPVVTAWGGTPPALAGPGARHGADPRTGRAATMKSFVFPLALPVGAPARYADPFAAPGPPRCETGGVRCPLTIESAPGTPVVASVGGRLRAARPAERRRGVAFWIVSGRNRVGLGALAAYSPGVLDGTRVRPGRQLGTSAGRLAVAWERGRVSVNPYPLLAATRAPG